MRNNDWALWIAFITVVSPFIVSAIGKTLGAIHQAHTTWRILEKDLSENSDLARDLNTYDEGGHREYYYAPCWGVKFGESVRWGYAPMPRDTPVSYSRWMWKSVLLSWQYRTVRPIVYRPKTDTAEILELLNSLDGFAYTASRVPRQETNDVGDAAE